MTTESAFRGPASAHERLDPDESGRSEALMSELEQATTMAADIEYRRAGSQATIGFDMAHERAPEVDITLGEQSVFFAVEEVCSENVCHLKGTAAVDSSEPAYRPRWDRSRSATRTG